LIFFFSNKLDVVTLSLILLSLLSTTTSFLLYTSTIYLFCILRVYVSCYPSSTTFLLYYHNLHNSRWHVFIDTTSHQTLSKHLLPIENKMRQRLSTITSISLCNQISLQSLEWLLVFSWSFFTASEDTIFSQLSPSIIKLQTLYFMVNVEWKMLVLY
jgi:hypothetical protein